METKTERVLIVDDHHYMRTMLKVIVEEAGYTIVGLASTAESGLKLVSTAKPDLVLLDIILPEMTGLELLIQIRKDYPAMKVIMVSSVSEDKIKEKALKNGASAFILKPFDPDNVLDVIEKTLNEAGG